MSSKISVEIWADVICPWCMIGKTRFEKALANSSAKDRFEIIHRAFRLAPGESVGPVEQRLAERYGKSPADVLQMLKSTEQTAAEDGLTFKLQGTFFGDTAEAHRLVLWSAEKARQEQMLKRLYLAYFTEGQNIFDRDVLTKLAGEVGLDPTDVAELLKTKDLNDEVEYDVAQTREFGVSGVPFFLFDGKFGLSGAQPTEIFEQAIAKVLEEIG